MIPLAAERPTLPLWPDVAEILGLGRSSVYQAAGRGEIPTITFGARKVVPTAALRRMLGLDVPGNSESQLAKAGSSHTTKSTTTADSHVHNT